MQQNSKRDAKLEEEFSNKTGMPLEKVLQLYRRAVENDWRTVQASTQQAIGKYAASRASAAEAADLLKLTRAILANENGAHLKMSGIDDPAP